MRFGGHRFAAWGLGKLHQRARDRGGYLAGLFSLPFSRAARSCAGCSGGRLLEISFWSPHSIDTELVFMASKFGKMLNFTQILGAQSTWLWPFMLFPLANQQAAWTQPPEASLAGSSLLRPLQPNLFTQGVEK